MSQGDSLTPQQQRELDEVIAGYLSAVEAGIPPDRRQLVARHPELAEHLRSFFLAHDEGVRETRDYEQEGTLPFSDTAGQSPMSPPSGDEVTLRLEGPAKRNAPRGSKPRLFGDYELIEEIARGGMGVVYKARQVRLNRIVALKMILAGRLASEQDVLRFYVEAEAAANLDHPGIVPIYEVGQHDGQHYFSMGYVEGESLADRVADGPLPPREAAELVMQIAAAIGYAHEHGVIHRDLKPGNVLLDATGNPRITDFGLAKQTQRDSQLTGTGQILGTPSYMPPEQAAGRLNEIGPLSDVYSLGAVLYALVTGRPPFQSAGVMDTLRQVLEQDPVPPRQLNAGVPIDLETICLKCLQKSPAKRYASAQEVADDLGRYLNREPILARPIGRLERGYRWCKRKPALALACLLALMVTAGAVAVPIAFAVYQTQAAQKLADEQTKTLAALEKAQAAERAALRQAADSTLDRGIQLCEQTDVSRGLVTFVRGLELAQQAGAADLEETFHWNLQAWGREVHTLQWMVSLPKAVQGLAVHPSGEWFAVVCVDNTLRLLATADGRPVQPPIEMEAPLWSVAISPDGKTLITSDSSKAHIFDIDQSVVDQSVQNRTVQKRLSVSTGAATLHVAFHPDGKVVATGGLGRTAQLWDLETGKPIGPPLSHSHQIYALAFTADGQRLVTTGERGSRLNVWSVSEGKLLTH